MNPVVRHLLRLPVVVVACAVAAACGGGGSSGGSTTAPNAVAVVPAPATDAVSEATFEVTTVNLTAAQPLSPVAVVAHRDGYRPFGIGASASDGLERLAEGSGNAAFVVEAEADPMVVATASGTGAIDPGGRETVTVEVAGEDLADLMISTVTALENTNDGISGALAVHAGTLTPGQSVTVRTLAYDAGTEANSELADDIAGPAAGGEGFNEDRGGLDRVTLHPGVVGDVGMGSSMLSEQYRFDNPVSIVRVERVQ